MKVGELFDLPENVNPLVGSRGNIKDENNVKVIGRYEVVKVDEGLKCKVIVTYGNKRQKHV